VSVSRPARQFDEQELAIYLDSNDSLHWRGFSLAVISRMLYGSAACDP
jgi:hypothetical protein